MLQPTELTLISILDGRALTRLQGEKKRLDADFPRGIDAPPILAIRRFNTLTGADEFGVLCVGGYTLEWAGESSALTVPNDCAAELWPRLSDLYRLEEIRRPHPNEASLATGLAMDLNNSVGAFLSLVRTDSAPSAF